MCSFAPRRAATSRSATPSAMNKSSDGAKRRACAGNSLAGGGHFLLRLAEPLLDVTSPVAHGGDIAAMKPGFFLQLAGP